MFRCCFSKIYILFVFIYQINCIRFKQVPFKEEFIEELKFVVKCSGTTKAVRHRKSASMDSRRSISSEQSNHSKFSVDKLQNTKFLENLNKVRYEKQNFSAYSISIGNKKLGLQYFA